MAAGGGRKTSSLDPRSLPRKKWNQPTKVGTSYVPGDVATNGSEVIRDQAHEVSGLSFLVRDRDISGIDKRANPQVAAGEFLRNDQARRFEVAGSGRCSIGFPTGRKKVYRHARAVTYETAITSSHSAWRDSPRS